MGGAERHLRPACAYLVAALAAGAASAAALRGLLAIDDPSVGVLFAGPGAAVILVLAVTAGRFGLRPQLRVFAAAPLLGFLLAAAAHLAIIVPLSLFYAPARDLLDVLFGAPQYETLDVRLMVVLLLTAAVIAPLTEEPAKAVPAAFARAASRRGAFLAGVTAGAGFGVVEHALYALPAAEYADVWVQVLLLRAVSAAMHPLASGFVFLGWWEFRRTGSRAPLVRGLALAVGLHAAWNATAVVMEGVAVVAAEGGVPRLLEAVGLGYAGGVGIGIAALTWHTITVIAAGDPGGHGEASGPPPPTPVLEWSSERRVWVALAFALVIPASLLAVILPRLS